MSKEISVNTLTPQQWAEIKSIGMEIYKSGQHGKDQAKCWIHAFVIWLVNSDYSLVEDVHEAPDSIH
jgi:hypothetical protein